MRIIFYFIYLSFMFLLLPLFYIFWLFFLDFCILKICQTVCHAVCQKQIFLNLAYSTLRAIVLQKNKKKRYELRFFKKGIDKNNIECFLKYSIKSCATRKHIYIITQKKKTVDFKHCLPLFLQMRSPF